MDFSQVLSAQINQQQTPASTEVTEPKTEPATTAQDAPQTDKPVEPPKPEEKNESYSQLISAVAKEKKRAFDLQNQLKTEKSSREALEARIKELESKYSKPENPEEALTRYGFNYEDVVNYRLNDNKPTPDMLVKGVKSELDEFKASFIKEKEDFIKSQRDAAEAQKLEAVSNFKTEIAETIVKESDKYELININIEPKEASEVIYNIIEKHWNDNKKVLQVEEAADLLEKHFEGLIEKASKAKKLASKFAPAKPEEKPKPTSSATLSNSVISSSAPSFNPARSEEERMARAMAKLDAMGR